MFPVQVLLSSTNPPNFRSRIKPELSDTIFGIYICKEGGEDTEERMEEEVERRRERMPLLRFSRLWLAPVPSLQSSHWLAPFPKQSHVLECFWYLPPWESSQLD